MWKTPLQWLFSVIVPLPTILEDFCAWLHLFKMSTVFQAEGIVDSAALESEVATFRY